MDFCCVEAVLSGNKFGLLVLRVVFSKTMIALVPFLKRTIHAFTSRDFS